MTRTIKFRGWDGKHMISPNTDKRMDVAVIVKNFDTLMQFTGLTDKNGKEIYEGDIVAYTGSEPDTTIHAEVFWAANSWRMRWKEGNSEIETGVHPLNLHTIEVIGNIHENSDLLEEHHG